MTNLAGKTVRWTEAYIAVYTAGCPNPELALWYGKLRDQRFIVVYDDGSSSVAVKGDNVYAIHRGSLEVVNVRGEMVGER